MQLSDQSFNRRQESLRSGLERDIRSFGLALFFAVRTPPCERKRLLYHSARSITMQCKFGYPVIRKSGTSAFGTADESNGGPRSQTAQFVPRLANLAFQAACSTTRSECTKHGEFLRLSVQRFISNPFVAGRCVAVYRIIHNGLAL